MEYVQINILSIDPKLRLSNFLRYLNGISR